MLPALQVVAPVTVRFAFARDRLSRDAWEPAYRLSAGRTWWRYLRLASSRGQVHPCAERLAQHVSWQLGDLVSLTNIREVLGGYAAYHHLSLRTAWTDWGRLVAAGWLAPIRAPANQGPSYRQGPGSGRIARYVLTVPAALVDQLRPTSLVTFSLRGTSLSPSVPPHRQHHRRGWTTLSTPTVAERRNASALLAGCHEPWRRQRPDHALLDRADWHRLLPLVAQAARHHPDVALSVVLTDRVASARHLPAVLAWRLWQLLHQPSLQDTRPPQPPAQHPPLEPLEEPIDDRHLTAVRTLGGPAAVRAALHTAQPRPAGQTATATEVTVKVPKHATTCSAAHRRTAT